MLRSRVKFKRGACRADLPSFFPQSTQ